MRVDQAVGHFGKNKFLDDEILYIRSFLRCMGYQSDIYAESNTTSFGVLSPVHIMHRNMKDIVIQHFPTSDSIQWAVMNSGAYHICRWHPQNYLKKLSYHGVQFLSILASAREIWSSSSCKSIQKHVPFILPRTVFIPPVYDDTRFKVARIAQNLIGEFSKDSFNILCLSGEKNRSYYDLCFALSSLKKNINRASKLYILAENCQSVKNHLKKSCHDFNLTCNVLNHDQHDDDVMFIDESLYQNLDFLFPYCQTILNLDLSHNYIEDLGRALSRKIPVLCDKNNDLYETSHFFDESNPQSLHRMLQMIADHSFPPVSPLETFDLESSFQVIQSNIKKHIKAARKEIVTMDTSSMVGGI